MGKKHTISPVPTALIGALYGKLLTERIAQLTLIDLEEVGRRIVGIHQQTVAQELPGSGALHDESCS